MPEERYSLVQDGYNNEAVIDNVFGYVVADDLTPVQSIPQPMVESAVETSQERTWGEWLWDNAVEIPSAIGAGIVHAGGGLVSLPADLAGFSRPRVSVDASGDLTVDHISAGQEAADFADELLPTDEAVSGFVKVGVQFATGYAGAARLGASKLLRYGATKMLPQNVAKFVTGRVATAAFTGALGDFAVTTKTAEALKEPLLGPYFEILTEEQDESAFETRLESVATGVLAGVLLDTTIAAVSAGVRKLFAAKRTGDTKLAEAAVEEIAEHQADLQRGLEKLQVQSLQEAVKDTPGYANTPTVRPRPEKPVEAPQRPSDGPEVGKPQETVEAPQEALGGTSEAADEWDYRETFSAAASPLDADEMLHQNADRFAYLTDPTMIANHFSKTVEDAAELYKKAGIKQSMTITEMDKAAGELGGLRAWVGGDKEAIDALIRPIENLARNADDLAARKRAVGEIFQYEVNKMTAALKAATTKGDDRALLEFALRKVGAENLDEILTTSGTAASRLLNSRRRSTLTVTPERLRAKGKDAKSLAGQAEEALPAETRAELLNKASSLRNLSEATKAAVECFLSF